jgi:two-component system NtrC family response regulator
VREAAEREALRAALDETAGNLSATARRLGVSRPTLYNLLRAHGIEVAASGDPVAVSGPEEKKR